MRYYKYTSQKYLEGFFETGSLRIGTLYEFRESKHGGAIGDADEAKHRYMVDYTDGGPIDMSSGSREAIFLREQGVFGNEAHELVGSYVTIGDRFTVANSSPDMYVFCMTSTFDEAAMAEFGYDACFEIIDVEGFLEALSISMDGKGQFASLVEITYKNRENSYTTPHDVHPAFMKGSEYAYQKEVRALWFTPQIKIEWFIAHAPAAVKFCRRYP